MPRRKVQFIQGHYYHIYNRGAGRHNLFIEQENYLYILRKMKGYLTEFSLVMIAYCLMPNHYHFLLRQDDHFSASGSFPNVCLVATHALFSDATTGQAHFLKVASKLGTLATKTTCATYAATFTPIRSKTAWFAVWKSGPTPTIWNGSASGMAPLLTTTLSKRCLAVVKNTNNLCKII